MIDKDTIDYVHKKLGVVAEIIESHTHIKTTGNTDGDVVTEMHGKLQKLSNLSITKKDN